MILADTSVWINFTHGKNDILPRLLNEEKVLTHKMVIGELKCGQMKNREKFFEYLFQLKCVQQISHEKVYTMIEEHTLMGTGVKFIDMHLIAACLHYNLELYSDDPRMMAIYKNLSS